MDVCNNVYLGYNPRIQEVYDLPVTANPEKKKACDEECLGQDGELQQVFG